MDGRERGGERCIFCVCLALQCVQTRIAMAGDPLDAKPSDFILHLEVILLEPYQPVDCKPLASSTSTQHGPSHRIAMESAARS